MKPFKETKVGKFLASKGLNSVLETVGDFVPGVRALDRIKDAVMGDNDNLSDQDKEEFMELYRLQLEEFDKIIADMSNARSRETEFVKATGHIDWMMTMVGVLVLLTFIGTLIMIGFRKLPEGSEHLMINAIGILEGLVLSVVSYYFGSSAGSRFKDMKR